MRSTLSSCKQSCPQTFDFGKMDSFSAPRYSYRFSCRVIDEFWERHTRGLSILEEIYQDVNKDHAIEIFRCDQKKWNIFKKLTKLCERLSYNPKMTLQDIKRLCLTNARHYFLWELGKTWTQTRISLDMVSKRVEN